MPIFFKNHSRGLNFKMFSSKFWMFSPFMYRQLNYILPNYCKDFKENNFKLAQKFFEP